MTYDIYTYMKDICQRRATIWYSRYNDTHSDEALAHAHTYEVCLDMLDYARHDDWEGLEAYDVEEP